MYDWLAVSAVCYLQIIPLFQDFKAKEIDTLRLHLTLTLWVQCIVHLRSTFLNFYQANFYVDMLSYML